MNMRYLRRLLSMLRRNRVEDDLNEELRYHLERQIEQNIANGLTPDQARTAAVRAFGNNAATTERLRELHGIAAVEAIWGDVRHGLRLLFRGPAFAVFATASLALGIGATVAIFSIYDAVVLRRLPVSKPQQLISLYMTMPGRGPNWSLPYPQFEAMRTRNTTLEGLTAVSTLDRVSVSTDGAPELSNAQAVSGDYFRLLGLQPAAGRLFTPQDDRADNAIVVISHGYWLRRFGGAASAVGASITINERPFTIVGVAPKRFSGLETGRSPELTIPMRALNVFSPAPFNAAFATWIYVVGRLKEGGTLQRAEQELDLIYRQVSQDAAAASPPQERDSSERLARDVHLKVESGSLGTASGLRNTYRRPLQLLLMLIGTVALMASLNVGTLLLARSASRQKEIATRLALGASRSRVVRQLMIESMVLAALATVVAIALSSWGSRFLLHMAMPSAQELPVTVGLSARLLLFAIGISLLTSLMFGLIPAIRTTSLRRANLASRQMAVTLERITLDRVLVGLQVGLSLILLVSAGLFARSLQSLWGRDTGYDRTNIVMFSLDAGLAGTEPSEATATYKKMLGELQELSTVESASAAIVRPVSGDFYLVDRVTQIGDRVLQGDERVRVAFNNVGPGYFSMLRIPLLAGREFEEQDNQPGAMSAIISETMSRRHFGDTNPVGQFISLGRDRRQIIGVAADVRYANVKDAPREVVYRPLFQAPVRFHVSFLIRYRGASEETMQQARNVVNRNASNLALFNVKTLDAQTAESLTRERLLTTLSTYFGGFALLLTCIGVYGLLNYSVTRRTPELGLRIAVGANRRDVYRLVLGESLQTVLIGSAVGLVGSFLVTRLLQSQLFDITIYDPLAFVAAILLLIVTAFTASMIPAARASRIDAIAALNKS
jgi:putative ABC transport system permease protein